MSDSGEPLVEYFVPRSISEFNLSDMVVVPPLRPCSALRTGSRAVSRDKMVTFEDEALQRQALEDVFM